MFRVKKNLVLAAHVVAIIPDVVSGYLDSGLGAPVINANQPSGVLQASLVKAGDLSRYIVGLVLKGDNAIWVLVRILGHFVPQACDGASLT